MEKTSKKTKSTCSIKEAFTVKPHDLQDICIDLNDITAKSRPRGAQLRILTSIEGIQNAIAYYKFDISKIKNEYDSKCKRLEEKLKIAKKKLEEKEDKDKIMIKKKNVNLADNKVQVNFQLDSNKKIKGSVNENNLECNRKIVEDVNHSKNVSNSTQSPSQDFEKTVSNFYKKIKCVYNEDLLMAEKYGLEKDDKILIEYKNSREILRKSLLNLKKARKSVEIFFDDMESGLLDSDEEGELQQFLSKLE